MKPWVIDWNLRIIYLRVKLTNAELVSLFHELSVVESERMLNDGPHAAWKMIIVSEFN